MDRDNVGQSKWKKDKKEKKRIKKAETVARMQQNKMVKAEKVADKIRKKKTNHN